MTDNIIELPKNEPPTLLIGPFQEWRVIIDGRVIPHLTGWRTGDEVWLCVDGRFAQGFPNEEVARGAAVLISQGMAVASGYAHLGAETKNQPFAAQAMEIKTEK